jgi:glycerophosphoryl diester phosphodiesterase
MLHRLEALWAVALLMVIAMVMALAAATRGQAGSATRTQSPGDREKRPSRIPHRAESRVVKVAHRGASGYRPENTLESVRLGIDMDADVVEIDVQQTMDGVLVVMHDTTLQRTTNVEEVFPDRGPWRIADFTYPEIQKLDAGGWFDPAYQGVRVPTLEEVLDELHGTGVGLLLEVKAPSRYPGIGGRIAEQLGGRPEWRDGSRKLILCSFDWAFVREYKRRMPHTTVAVNGTPRYRDLGKIAEYADLVNPQFGTVNATYLRRVHQLGMRSFSWTVDEPGDMRKLLAMGIDGIISNKPDVLGKVLEPGQTLAA